MQKQWWHNKVAYQIYPKSFCDSNGDGIGDLRGIIQKLDYLKSLGVDIVWISPVYCSPFVDQGYDIADYYNIDPIFGTMEDMEELLAQAKKRDMHILMDLVVNHCSSRHLLFQKAMADPDGEYGSFFYIRDGKPDGTPPCNWRSYFGGSAWEKVPGTHNKYYLHLFAKEQPDLNWENPMVRRRIYDMINWWLDKGLSGFRIDAIINIKKDLRFQDFPSDRPDGLCSPHFMLDAATGVGDFLREMRDETFRKHNAISVAEAFNIRDEDFPLFVGNDGYFSTIFDFSTELLGKDPRGWYCCAAPSVQQVRDTIYASQAQIKDYGFFCNITENHDEPRGVSQYLPADGQNDYGKKLLALVTFLRKGLPFLYQGQEIGMTNCPFESIDELDDINTLDEYQVAKKAGLSDADALEKVLALSRDNSRTPMQWNGERNAGFTGGTPWLRVNPNYTSINVASQEADPNSVLNFYRALAALRKDQRYQETIVYGDFKPILTEYPQLYAFYRSTSRQRLLVLANCQGCPLTLFLPEKGFDTVVLNNYPELLRSNDVESSASSKHTAETSSKQTAETSCKQAMKKGQQITLQPYQAVIVNYIGN
ncbi:MAG: alpha-glucosidase [Paludibacter sp.]|nr:alpha-glucosidase [Paludibacter sp.]